MKLQEEERESARQNSHGGMNNARRMTARAAKAEAAAKLLDNRPGI